MLMYVPVGVGFNLVVGNLGLLAFSNVALLRHRRLHHRHADAAARLALVGRRSSRPASWAAVAGCAASVPALRGVRAFYLAIMTLAFGELMRWVYIRWEPLTGGSMGMAVPPPTCSAGTLDHRRAQVLRLPCARRRPGGRRHRPAAALPLRPRLPRHQGQRGRRRRHGHPDRPLHRAVLRLERLRRRHRRRDVRRPGRPSHPDLVRPDRADPGIRHHHGGRPRQPDRVGDRRGRHHRRAAGVRSISRAFRNWCSAS